jgi:hypothetical protein
VCSSGRVPACFVSVKPWIQTPVPGKKKVNKQIRILSRGIKWYILHLPRKVITWDYIGSFAVQIVSAKMLTLSTIMNAVFLKLQRTLSPRGWMVFQIREVLQSVNDIIKHVYCWCSNRAESVWFSMLKIYGILNWISILQWLSAKLHVKLRKQENLINALSETVSEKRGIFFFFFPVATCAALSAWLG